MRAHFSTAHVGLVVGSEFAEFVRTLGLFDDVYAFDARVAYHGRMFARASLLARLAVQLRATRPDSVGVLKGAPAYAALAVATGARERVGLTRGWGHSLLNVPLAIDPTRHHADQYADVARALGASHVPLQFNAWPETSVPAEVALLRGQGGSADLGRALVAVAPGGARNTKEDFAPKRWSAARFSDALLRAADARPLSAVVLGGPSDRAEADALVSAVAGRIPVLDLVGQTSVFGARAIIASSDAYLGNDSALMHVAGTTPTPIVAVFGPTDPRVLAPRGAHVYTIWRPARPYPCRDEVTGAARPCAAECCIDRVDAAEVASVLGRALTLSANVCSLHRPAPEDSADAR